MFGQIVGAVVRDINGNLQIVQVAGFDTPPAAPPEVKVVPPKPLNAGKRPLASHLGLYSKVNYRSKGGNVGRYEIRAVSEDRRRVRLVGFGGRCDFWVDAEVVW